MNSSRTPNSQLEPTPEPVDLSQQSVAGEEDPGASLDMDSSPSRQPEASAEAEKQGQPVSAASATCPGEEAAPAAPGTGGDICRKCGASGQFNGSECPACGGTGKVTVGLGGE